MKAPDKIFLVKPFCASEQDHAFISDVELPHYLNTCYIRKDALMEMLLTMEARHSVFYLEGKIVREIIDELNSL